jgi:hypothetical protein
MLRKKIWISMIALNAALISLAIEAAPNRSSSANQNNSNQRQEDAERDEIMREDQVDNTDIYAIPLDSSEVEDEEQINRLEGKQEFKIGR